MRGDYYADRTDNLWDIRAAELVKDRETKNAAEQSAKIKVHVVKVGRAFPLAILSLVPTALVLSIKAGAVLETISNFHPNL